MADRKVQTLSRSPTRKFMQSTFPSTMADSMSGDELSLHLGRQVALQNEKYKEPEPAVEEKKEKTVKRKFSKFKNQQSHHGVILQGTEQMHVKKKETVTTADEDDDLDEYEEENLKMIKEKEHDDLIKGLLLLREYYKTEYKKALQDKIEKQKKTFQQRQAYLEEEAKLSQELEQEVRHKVSHKLPRSFVLNDSQFKSGIQTDLNKIIGLESKLKKEGFLKKSHEVKEFWDFITVPENLQSVLEQGELTWETIKRYHKEHSKAVLAGQVEITQPKREVKTKRLPKGAASSWRSATHGIRTILTPSIPSDAGRKSSSFASSGKSRSKKTPPSSAIPIEQRFPKVEFPPLAAYRLEFGEKEPDPEEVRKQEEAFKRLEARNGLKRTLNTMFSHALANKAATHRLMEKNEDYNFESLSGIANFEEIHELASVKLKPSAGSASKKPQSRKSSGKSTDGKSPAKSRSVCSRKTNTPENDTTDRSESNISLSSKEDLVVELPPLTLNQLAKDCDVKESKCLSTFWVNPVAKRTLNSYEDWKSAPIVS
ncbi:unnamed protein product [Porites lobata]|uniref:Uncharacterized protein n=1 Tax=Porites lobata TaxID=104759 RepID=A0ABN8MP99_9CNID|nr:unnamed protein product [Porites lobata]